MGVELNLKEKSWQGFDGVWVLGRVVYNERVLAPKELKTILEKSVVNGLVDLELLKSIIRRFRGFYSIIWISANCTLLIADTIRSYPLFFAKTGKDFALYDHLHAESSLSELDESNIVEFALTGFVTGPETLIKGVFQVQAGEFVLLNHSTSEVKRVLYEYFAPEHPKIIEGVYEDTNFIKRLDKAVSVATERLVNYLDGRVAVIPLSGGWDSRTILLHLKRQGYPRILTFSYGKEGNSEAQISSDVARQLGVEWIFVPYRVNDWRAVAETSEYWKYIIYAHNGVSTPHIQDFLAVRQMVRSGVLTSEDAVLIPGHSADFVAGSHLRREYGKIRKIEDLINAIFAKHYTLIPYRLLHLHIPEVIELRREGEYLGKINKKLVNQARDYYKEIPFRDPYAFLDFWDWRERQAKFIVNSVKVYKFWGLDFWLPLWDQDFVRFWHSIPLEWRMDRALYRKYLLSLQAEMNLKIPVTTKKARIKQAVKLFLQHAGLMTTFMKIQTSLLSARNLYDSHSLQWYGIWDRTSFNDLVSRAGGQINVNTLVTLDILKTLYLK